MEPKPLLLAASAIPPWAGESWPAYKTRIARQLEPLMERAVQAAGLQLTPLFAANGLYGVPTEDAQRCKVLLALGSAVSPVERFQAFRGEQMDDVGRQIHLRAVRRTSEVPRGQGVAVAILDSGIDAHHPFLEVAEAVSTCPEPPGTSSRHGTHCAGIVASRHPEFPGIAPGVRLVDVKIARADGWTSPAYLAKGIDEALDRGADVLSISFGLNSLPPTVTNGHDWLCSGGRCLLCRAVDHAAGCGALVVAAAGNEYLRAQTLRKMESWSKSTDLLCPGRARQAITVGAIEKEPSEAMLASSSRGPGDVGEDKPELVAPGADIVSTIPSNLWEEGKPALFALFGSASGTSAATAVVAGVLALLIEQRASRGLPWTVRAIREELLESHTRLRWEPAMERHVRLLDLSDFVDQR